MVICDLCKSKTANNSADFDPDYCTECRMDVCKNCSVELEGYIYCRNDAPKCKDCNTTITQKYVACELCEDYIHKTCAHQVKYDKPGPSVGHHFKMLKITMRDVDRGWFCKTHFDAFEAHKAESTIIIEYSIKLFKALGLPPLKIERHVIPEADPNDTIAEFQLKNDWKAFIVHPNAATIFITIRGMQFDNTIKVSTYNHELAVNTLREKLIKLLLHHKRALSAKKKLYSTKSKTNYIDYINMQPHGDPGNFDLMGPSDDPSPFEAHYGVAGITDMLKIITASKDTPAQDTGV